MYNLILNIEKKENKKLRFINNEMINKNLNDLNKYELLNLFNEILEINYISFYFSENKENEIYKYKLMFNRNNDLYFKNNYECFKRNENENILRNEINLIIKHILNNKKLYLN